MEHQHERADVYEIAVVFSDGYEALVTTTLKPPRQGPNGQVDTRSVKLQVRGPSRRTLFVRSYDQDLEEVLEQDTAGETSRVSTNESA